MEEFSDLIKKCYEDFKIKVVHYDKINKYYYGTTDSLRNFTPMQGRSNLKVKTNFIQKLVDKEASYSFGNKVTYTSNNDDKEVISDIKYILKNLKENHTFNVGIDLVKYGLCYEINYIDSQGRFRCKKVSPLEGYALVNEEDEVELFLHIFNKKLDNNKTFIDVYTVTKILHLDSSLKEVAEPTPHYFGIVPVGVAKVCEEDYSESRGYIEGDKTIFRTIKNIQDALETNLGDITSEISDFRNAILKLKGISPEVDEKTGEAKEPVIRNNSVLWLDGDKVDAEWLIKNINDTFIKNTRDDLINLIYTLTNHIDDNITIASNVSGVALRSRLQSLESKCRENENAMIDLLKVRLQCMFKYLYLTQSKKYDINLIDITFTPFVPQDTTALADIISKIPHDVVSYQTLRKQLPFIDNPDLEQQKIDAENKKVMEEMVDLDSINDPLKEDVKLNEGGINETE